MLFNIRVERDIVEMFDKVAARHSRDRSKEMRSLMLDDIHADFPDWQPAEDPE